jgi:hypothetical protein
MTSRTDAQELMPPQARKVRSDSGAHRWAKRRLRGLGKLLGTGNQNDTISRLFDSQHVNDLRLIVASAYLVATVVFFLSLMFAVASYTVYWQRHGADPTLGRAFTSLQSAGGDFIKFVAPTMGVLGGILAWAYQVGSARLGVVDLFAAEIDTLCRAITITDFVNGQLTRQPALAEAGAPAGNDVEDSNEFVSQENYFPILESNARDLQALDAEVLTHISAFYAYMKAVRDSLRRLADAPHARLWGSEMTDMIYLTLLALESGRKATDDLVEFDATYAERTMVILISELPAYVFLREQFRTRDEMHFNRLILRGPVYRELMERLLCALSARGASLHHALSRAVDHSFETDQWAAAIQLRPELEKRYEEAKRLPLECRVSNAQIVLHGSG